MLVKVLIQKIKKVMSIQQFLNKAPNSKRLIIEEDEIDDIHKLLQPYKNNELLPITEYTELKIQPPAWNWEKTLEEGILYIDDVCDGTPMIPNIALPFGLMVDWKTLEEWFTEQGII